ncbi:TetR/AcrR family transcriptional regulator [Leucobacter sp. L43]|uniref:TetR/AcrR family transcriptional regulator n=1 Tax=Leucobacter sp. L43 TaxID=2798040 RepID=UPI001902E30E|nr:TetR/AcrR family transcriptional regulator [Leucobacter sp. L43]
MDDAEARERIAGAAEDLYYRKGFSAVGMDEIRSSAGVSLRRLYALFPSKDAVITEVLARRHAQWERGLAEQVSQAGNDTRRRLLAVFDYLDGWFRDPAFRGCAFINAFGELGGTRSHVAAIVRDHKASFQQCMTELVRTAGGSELLAAQLSILAEGAQSTAAIGEDPSSAAQARLAAEVLIAHETSREAGGTQAESTRHESAEFDPNKPCAPE